MEAAACARRQRCSFEALHCETPCACAQLAAKCETRQSLFNIQTIAVVADCLIRIPIVSQNPKTTLCARAQLAAKCETRQSLFNIQTIAVAADCLIMSRGNLGLDVLPEKMALVQKAMINSCTLLGKPILITRVVDTMVNAPRPTRCADPRRPCSGGVPSLPHPSCPPSALSYEKYINCNGAAVLGVCQCSLKPQYDYCSASRQARKLLPMLGGAHPQQPAC